jgi:hypothetical protein
MAARRPAYLHKNRHETFYLRRAIPRGLREVFKQREFYCGLRTKDPRVANLAALRFLAQLGSAFELLEQMVKKKQKWSNWPLRCRMLLHGSGVAVTTAAIPRRSVDRIMMYM